MEHKKPIMVKQDTWETLSNLKRPGETFDMVINRLIENLKPRLNLEEILI